MIFFFIFYKLAFQLYCCTIILWCNSDKTDVLSLYVNYIFIHTIHIGCLIKKLSKVNRSEGWRIENFDNISLVARSQGLIICVSSTSFQKSSISWPQKPPTEKVLKFNLRFHDSTSPKYFSKHQNKAEFKNLDDSEVPSCDFPGLRTSTASMISTAWFHQKNYWSCWLDHSWHQNDQ